jgi:hypothetical protein
MAGSAYLHPASSTQQSSTTMDGHDDDYLDFLAEERHATLRGFPWNTFIERKGNATISGPLRQSTNEALSRDRINPNRQWFQFHAASEWQNPFRGPGWDTDHYGGISPIEVPILEQYFVLFQGDFAHWFFSRVLTDEFVSQSSDWGPDLIWCGAANEYRPSQVSCSLVPVVSLHEDSRQIETNDEFMKKGANMMNYFRNNHLFRHWFLASQHWQEIIGGAGDNTELERRCKSMYETLRSSRQQFDIEKCSRLAIH